MDLHIGDTAISSVKSGCNTSECSLVPDELEEPSEHIILVDKNGAIYCKNSNNKENLNENVENQNLMDYNSWKSTIREDYWHDQRKISSIQSKPKLNYSIQKIVNVSDIEELNISSSKRPPLVPITERCLANKKVEINEENFKEDKCLLAKDFIEREHEVVTLKIDINENSKQDEVFVTNTADGSVKRLIFIIFTSSQRNGERSRKAKNYNSMNSGSHSINCDFDIYQKTAKIVKKCDDQDKENKQCVNNNCISTLPMKYNENKNKEYFL